MKERTGGRILVDALKIHGVDRVFCVSGESFIAALDAFYDERDAIRVIVNRQEGGAANMAEAHGKLTGSPGICFVTRGPGATNASIGVHTAMQDSSPMMLFIGQVPRTMAGREAFQEIDFRAMFAPIAKWVVQIEDARRIPEIVSRAFYTATSGRPGPVVIALPEDMLRERVATKDAPPYAVVRAHPGADQLALARTMLAGAERPLILAGGGGWDIAACDDLRAFAERNGLPVVTSFRRQDLFDNVHPLYAGVAGIGIDPPLGQRIKDADVLLAVGARLTEIATQEYALLDVPAPKQRLIHVHASTDELGRVYAPELAINSGPAEFVEQALTLEPLDGRRWSAWAQAAHADYLAYLEGGACPGALDMRAVLAHLRAVLPDDAIVTNGAGNFASWVNRYYQYRRFRTQLGPTSGAMGYGFPAAIAAKLEAPARTVVAFAGDGDFMMTGQELATAVQHEVAVIVIVVNNGMWGTIRMHQETRHPGRVIATDLRNPDFAAYARAFGALGEVVERTEDFAGAFARAQAFGGPALLELRLDPEALSPRTSLSALRTASQAKR